PLPAAPVSPNTSAWNVTTSVPASRHASEARPAFRHPAARNVSGPQLYSAATCGSSSPIWRPRRTIRPSRPITMRAGSTGSRGSGAAAVNTEISRARRGSSSGSTGGKRGSSRAAATVISRTTSPSGRSSATWPTQPRSAPPVSMMVTNAPRLRAAPGEPGRDGRGRPARCATSVARARCSSATRSAAVNSGSAMIRLPATDRVRPIQLLVQDDARQLVWKREARQAPDPLGAAQHRRRQGFGAAQGEGHVAPLKLPAGGPVRQLGGRPLVPLLRQRDEARALGNCVENSRLGLHFPLLHRRVTPQPLEVSVTRRPQRRVPHAAHRDDVIAHQAYIPRSRCIAATRSIAIMYDAIRVFTLWRSAQVTTSENERTMMLSSR